MPILSLSQVKSGYYLTNEQHELLRKDLIDYKLLIERYNIQIQNFEVLKSEYKQQRLLNTAQQAELDSLRSQKIENCNLLIKISRLEKEKQDAINLNLSLQRDLKYKTNSLNYYKGKYMKETKKRSRRSNNRQFCLENNYCRRKMWHLHFHHGRH
jgi:hypothetical protein